MAATRGIALRNLFTPLALIVGSALLAACRLPLARPDPTPTLILTPAITDSSFAPLPTLTPRPTQPPTPTPLACARLLTPQNGATLPPVGRVTFSWQPMPDAALYWLEIRLPDGQMVTFDSTGSRDLYSETFRLDGVYYWQVSAMARGGALLCTSDAFIFHKGR